MTQVVWLVGRQHFQGSSEPSAPDSRILLLYKVILVYTDTLLHVILYT